MKKFTKYMSFSSFALAAAFMLASCDDTKDNDLYTSYTGTDAAGAYFPSSVKTTFDVNTEQSVFSFPLFYRGKAEGATTIAYTATPLSDIVSEETIRFSGTASFANGDFTAPISFTVEDVESLPVEVKIQYLIQIDPEYDTPLGSNSVVISIQRPGPWTSLGLVTYSDYIMGINDYSVTTQVEMFVSDSDPNLYRIQNPYEFIPEDADTYLQLRVLQQGETYLDEVVPQTGLVAFEDFRMDFNSYYGEDVYMIFPGEFNEFADPSNWVYNYVYTWQEEDPNLPGAIVLSPFYYMFGLGGWNYTTSEGINIEFPGYQVLDTGALVTYNGMMTNADGTKDVLAYVQLGSDVEYAKVAVITGNLLTTALKDQIEDGTIESVTIRNSSDVYLPFDVTNNSGKYSVVVLTYYNDEFEKYDLASFTYSSSTNDVWSPVTSGLYSYLGFWIEAGVLEDEVLDLYVSENSPNKYMIDNWFFGVPFVFYMDEDGMITVENQTTGAATPDYGEIFVDDVVSYFGSTMYGYSYFEDGIYYFDVIYYDNEGMWDYGYETFDPTSVAPSPASYTRAANSNAKSFEMISADIHRTDKQVKKRKLINFVRNIQKR